MRLIRRRICALLLCMILIAGLLPMTGTSSFFALAAENDTPGSDSYGISIDIEPLAAAGASYATPEDRAEAVNEMRYRYIAELLSHVGSPYVKGKGHFSRSKEFDCSGLIAHAFIALGYSRYFSISEKSWNPGKFQAYDSNGVPSSAWKDFSWRGSHGLLENVKDGQQLYLIPDSSKKPVLVFTVRKSDKKNTDFASNISNPSKWTDDFRDAVSRRGTILVKNHASQTKWHTTAVVGCYDADWFLENGYDINPAKASISTVKSAIRQDLQKELSGYGFSVKSLSRVHRGLANGALSKEKIGGKNTNSSFNDLDREDDVYPAMWDLRQRAITSGMQYSPLWQVDALNPRMGVSVNNSTLALNQDYSIAMVLEWEEFGDCHLTDYDNTSDFGGADRPIAGAEYAIYRKDTKESKKKNTDETVTWEELADRKPLATAIADENGEVHFRGLTLDGVTHQSDFYVIELSPPEGCEANRTIYPVTLTTDDDVEIVEGGIVTCRYLTGSLSVLLDKEGCMVYPGEGSRGFTTTTLRTVDVTDSRSELFRADATYQILAGADIVRNGHVLYRSGEVVSTISGSANDTVTADHLLLDSYYVRIKAAPAGWSSTSPGKTTSAAFKLSGEQLHANRVLTCSRQRLGVSFRLTDSAGNPVTGGRYALCCGEDVYDYTGQNRVVTTGAVIAVSRADEDGNLAFGISREDGTDAFADMPSCCSYYLVELEAPDGYLPKDYHLVEFTYSDTAWAYRNEIERSFSVVYGDGTVIAEATDLPEEAAGFSVSSDDTISVLSASAAGSYNKAALPLVMLLILLSGATVLLLYHRSREENA